MSKFSILKENMHRFKTKNLAEQQDIAGSTQIQKWLNKPVPAEMVFMKDFKDETDRNRDLAITDTKMPVELKPTWDDLIEQYRKTKDQRAFAQLMKIIKNTRVTIQPYNGGEISPYKYEAVGDKLLKLVKV